MFRERHQRGGTISYLIETDDEPSKGSESRRSWEVKEKQSEPPTTIRENKVWAEARLRRELASLHSIEESSETRKKSEKQAVEIEVKRVFPGSKLGWDGWKGKEFTARRGEGE